MIMDVSLLSKVTGNPEDAVAQANGGYTGIGICNCSKGNILSILNGIEGSCLACWIVSIVTCLSCSNRDRSLIEYSGSGTI